MVDARSMVNFQRKVYISDSEVILNYNDKPRNLRIRSSDVSLISKDTSLDSKQKIDIMAVYGIVKLINSYLIVVTRANIVGTLLDSQIFQVDQIQFIPLSTNRSKEDQTQIGMLTKLFNTRTFYFSDKYDLTNSLQRQSQNNQPASEYEINEHLTWQFRQGNCQDFVPRFISGLVAYKYVRINNRDCELLLITRRDKRRMGRRFVSRGSDLDGNCSNYAETEQILRDHVEKTYHSFVQVRGSMPFKWKQKPNLMWAPRGVPLGEDQMNQVICSRHFDSSRYGRNQVLINLIDKKGNQKFLGEYFQKMVMPLKIKYIWFDFHHECRGMKYENLSKLLETVKQDLISYDHFSVQIKQDRWTVLTTQNGVMRTNCLDNLDRTNVVQSVFGRHMLWQMLPKMGIQKTGPSVLEPFPLHMEQAFREVWTTNADAVSLLYTGTGALKTDFTRFGKRTKKGALQDGRNSIVRYFLGNFYDGDTQNAIDLLTGKLNPSEHSFSLPILNPIFYLMFLITSIPLLAYYASTHPRVLQTIGFSESGETAKMWAFVTVTVLGSLFLLKTYVMKNYGLFVRKPYIEH